MKIFTNSYFVIAFIIPFLGIDLLDIPLLEGVVKVAQIGVAFIGYFSFFYRLKYNGIKKSNFKFYLLLILYSFTIFFCAFINRGITVGIIFTCTIYIGFFLYIDWCILRFHEFIKGIAILFSGIIIASFMMVILNPTIAFEQHGNIISFIGILGGKNSVQLIIAPALLMLLIGSYFNKNKLTKGYLIIIILGIIFIYFSKSSTAMIISFILIIYLIFHKRIMISLNSILLIYLVLFLSIVIFRLQEVLLGDFIRNYLGKDITLTGRTYIWDMVFNNIKNSLWFGFGNNNNIIAIEYAKIVNHDYIVNEAHNGILQILLYTGVIGVGQFINLLRLVAKKVRKYKNEKIASILSMGIFIFLIIGLTESVFSFAKVMFWILLIMAINIDYILKLKNNYNE